MTDKRKRGTPSVGEKVANRTSIKISEEDGEALAGQLKAQGFDSVSQLARWIIRQWITRIMQN